MILLNKKRTIIMILVSYVIEYDVLNSKDLILKVNVSAKIHTIKLIYYEIKL